MTDELILNNEHPSVGANFALLAFPSVDECHIHARADILERLLEPLRTFNAEEMQILPKVRQLHIGEVTMATLGMLAIHSGHFPILEELTIRPIKDLQYDPEFQRFVYNFGSDKCWACLKILRVERVTLDRRKEIVRIWP